MAMLTWENVVRFVRQLGHGVEVIEGYRQGIILSVRRSIVSFKSITSLAGDRIPEQKSDEIKSGVKNSDGIKVPNLIIIKLSHLILISANDIFIARG